MSSELLLNMRRVILFTFILISAGIYSCKRNCSHTEGSLIRLEGFTPQWIDNRFVDVWVPPCYDQHSGRRYPVIYMHDGQNLFNTSTAYGGVEWAVDETIARLMAEEKTNGCIIVGIWNTPKRFAEYAPYKPFSLLKDETKFDLMTEFNFEDEPLSDRYLAFIVNELKPHIDQHFRTLSDRENTFIMGSSMGGLISLYAVAEYPDIFGGAGCLSTHWPFRLKENDLEFTNACVQYLQPLMDNLQNSKIYFDHGTLNLDAWYEVNQKVIDSLFLSHGFDSEHYLSLKFEGHDHNEKSWSERVETPLMFLLNRK